MLYLTFLAGVIEFQGQYLWTFTIEQQYGILMLFLTKCSIKVGTAIVFMTQFQKVACHHCK